MMRSLAIAALCGVLLVVYWLGATVYSEKIEVDISSRTHDEIGKHRPEIPGISRVVDGRDVRLFGETPSVSARSDAGEATEDVWGVRVLENQISVAEAEVIPEIDATGYLLQAEHDFPDLRIAGRVDEAGFETLGNIHLALPPDTSVDLNGLTGEAPELLRSSRIVETGIAAVTQMNPGTLTVTDEQFILDGTVNSYDRKRTIEQLIDVRRADIEPLEIIVNIVVDTGGITQACQAGIEQVLANNVLNYAVDHYRILDEHDSALTPMIQTITGVCDGQINTVLVEGHADFTGGAGYNQGLSERRSGTVMNYMIEQGVDPALVSAHGYGEFRPIASNDTADGRSQNRRTEIYLILHNQLHSDPVPSISFSDE